MSNVKNTEGAVFPTVQKPLKGYDKEQVDSYLKMVKAVFYNETEVTTSITSNELRTKSFDLRNKGYDPRYVDAALDRLEDVFYAREREDFLKKNGYAAFKQKNDNLLQELKGRMERDKKERFKTRSFLAHGYKISQVDAALDQITQVISRPGIVKPNQIRHLRFHSQRGGYDEAQVDAFLDAVIDYLLATK